MRYFDIDPAVADATSNTRNARTAIIDRGRAPKSGGPDTIRAGPTKIFGL